MEKDTGLKNVPRLAVQILAYKHPGAEGVEEELDACLRSLEGVDYPKERWCIIILDNRSPDGSLYEFLEREWLPRSGKTLPALFLQKSEVNTGFAGGHAKVLEASKKWGADFVYLLNQDTRVHQAFLREAILGAQPYPQAAVIQSYVHLAEQPELLNARGNCLHFLGFGYSDGYRQTPEQAAQSTKPHFYASGAGVLVRVSALERIGGLFDPFYFLYHEDTDLCWRARLAGFEIAFVPASIIYHRYEFARSRSKFYFIERNRPLLLASNLHLRTLVLLLPALLVVEVGTLILSLRSGWGREKIRAWKFLLLPSTWKWLRSRRKIIRFIRCVPDREILTSMVGIIDAQEVNNPFLSKIVNPILNAYFVVLKKVVRW